MKIEKNIPIPPKMFNKTRGNKWTKLLGQMEIGDSFAVKNSTMKNPSSNFYPLTKTLNIKLSVRKEENGHRVWRTA